MVIHLIFGPTQELILATAILEILKKAGVNWLGLGIENPNNEHRRYS